MILFTTKKDKQQLLIGGQSKLSEADNGGVIGPFPRYSINSENVFTGNGTYVNTKFVVNVTGTAVLNKLDDKQNILVAGQRQSRVQGEMLTILQFGRHSVASQRIGRLEIGAYGGINDNKIIFEDAIITSIDMPEQTEESSGVQNVEYSFSFEAFIDRSINKNFGSTIPPDGEDDEEVKKLDYNVKTAEESWDIQQVEGQLSFYNNNPKDLRDSRKVYTLTHNLSAVGVRQFRGTGDKAGEMIAGDEAFREAARWVSDRAVADPMKVLTVDMFDDATMLPSTFTPADMNAASSTLNRQNEFGFYLSENGESVYKAYNHVRQLSHNVAEGSYSLTDTWTLCAEEVTATHEIEFSFESNPESTASVMNVSATFTGLSTNPSSRQDDNKYSGALSAFTAMRGNIFDAARDVYRQSGGIGTLRNLRLSETVSHNKIGGTISYTTSYSDLEVLYPNPDDIIAETIEVSYNNDGGAVKSIVLHPVLLRDIGPIIQDMGVTPEKTVTITVSLVMSRTNRASKPPIANVMTMIEPYIPEAFGDGPFITDKTESFSPTTGSYSLSITYTYT